MTQTRQRIIFVALTALLAIFSGCKGESPTAPPPITGTNGGGTGGSGGTPPQAGSTVTLTASSATPLTNSTSTITATVTNNGSPVPNGTAVEFSTTSNNATFTDTPDNPKTLIRTTTNGVATATVTSTTAGVVTVTATVNNVAKSINVTFQDPVIPVIPAPTNPTITAVTPAIGLPTGNQTITITGTNFKAPVRVLFDPGNGQTPKEAFVTSVTPTQITVITPAFDLGSGQQQAVSIIVITEAGSATEQRVVRPAAFTYQAAVLTPIVRAISPTSGPIDGGTRVTIIGDAFEAPAQVFFGSAQAQVLTVEFHQIVVIAPTARDTAPDASGPVTGPIDVRVLNVNSGKSTTATAGFRYIAKMQITTVAPGTGSAFGGTTVTIDGTGFDDPLAVSIGGVPASVIRVSGTQVIAITGRAPIPCTPPSGAVTVTNTNNGDSATGPVFAYAAEKPLITAISAGSGTIGSSLQVTVAKPGVGIDGSGLIRFKLGTATAFPTPGVIVDPFGPTTFTMTIPTVTLPDVVCTTSTGLAGTKKGTQSVDVVFTNVTTGCTDTVVNGLTVQPTDTQATCTPPPAQANPTASVSPNPLCPIGTTNIGTSINGILTVRNTAATGAQSLSVTSVVVSGPAGNNFTVSPTALTVAPGGAAPITVTFTPSASGVRNATVTIFTNDPANSTIVVPVCGTGT
jgi:hypothetical protein